MFAAAMLYAAPSVELSIYSTCKRISQKLLRNDIKFFYEICQDNLEDKGFKVVRQNMEEITVRGPLGVRDTRVVNSYPSKVSIGGASKSLKVNRPKVTDSCLFVLSIGCFKMRQPRQAVLPLKELAPSESYSANLAKEPYLRRTPPR